LKLDQLIQDIKDWKGYSDDRIEVYVKTLTALEQEKVKPAKQKMVNSLESETNTWTNALKYWNNDALSAYLKWLIKLALTESETARLEASGLNGVDLEAGVKTYEEKLDKKTLEELQAMERAQEEKERSEPCPICHESIGDLISKNITLMGHLDGGTGKIVHVLCKGCFSDNKKHCEGKCPLCREPSAVWKSGKSIEEIKMKLRLPRDIGSRTKKETEPETSEESMVRLALDAAFGKEKRTWTDWKRTLFEKKPARERMSQESYFYKEMDDRFGKLKESGEEDKFMRGEIKSYLEEVSSISNLCDSDNSPDELLATVLKIAESHCAVMELIDVLDDLEEYTDGLGILAAIRSKSKKLVGLMYKSKPLSKLVGDMYGIVDTATKDRRTRTFLNMNVKPNRVCHWVVKDMRHSLGEKMRSYIKSKESEPAECEKKLVEDILKKV